MQVDSKQSYRDVCFRFWLIVTEHVRKLFSVLDHYKQSLRSLLNITGMIRKNAEDPKVATGLDGMENSLTGTDASNNVNWSGAAFYRDHNGHSEVIHF